MNFPKTIPDDDIDLIKKEWKLTGLHVDDEVTGESGVFKGRRAVLVYACEPDKPGSYSPDLLADFTQRTDGRWVRVTPGSWLATIEEAEAYGLPEAS